MVSPVGIISHAEASRVWASVSRRVGPLCVSRGSEGEPCENEYDGADHHCVKVKANVEREGERQRERKNERERGKRSEGERKRGREKEWDRERERASERGPP